MIVVAGAGPGGLVAALALQRRGFEVTVLERSPELRTAGAGLLLQPNALAMLRALDLVDPIAAAGIVMESAAVQDASGASISGMPFAALTPRFGAPAIGILRASLSGVLAAGLAPGTLRFDAGVAGVRQGDAHVEIDLEDGTTVTGAALIGADGIHSRVRAAVMGAIEPRYSGYTCWRGIVGLPHPAGPRRMVERWGRGNRFGMVPVSDATTYWFATANTAPGGIDGDDPIAELRARFAGFAAPVDDVLAATPPEAVLRNDIVDLAPLDRWTDGRVALLGDAAHAMTPNMGQGACQAIEDGVVLASVYDPSDPAGSLATYAGRRRDRARMFVDRSWSAGRMGQWENGLACAVRNTLARWTPGALVERMLVEQWSVEVPELR
ncbi:MAG: FAD-dependent monooxygenase [Alphaproteobacteria bacterium]|nr:FAD-dependent monooxygenase [Alphaproteobacteria bacterium]